MGRWGRRTLDEALRDLSYTYYGYTYYGYTYYGSTHYGAPLMRPCATFAYSPLGSRLLTTSRGTSRKTLGGLGLGVGG